ncbi:MAG: hypothetical protein BRC52_09600 [Cyanobacteria bacterium SW_5_48_44]|nr:MAG: hypothetical protein BRC52_09600 [Cyanobacteria bacterium SW_5_48_44]
MTRLIRDYCPEGTTVGRYLHRWGRSPQKPTAPAREQCPYQVQQW